MAKRRKGVTGPPKRLRCEGQLEHQANAFLKHYQARRLQEAAALAREITECHPTASFGWKALGAVLLESGDALAAVASLEHALELHPDNNETLINLGQALQQLGRHEEAEACLTQALAGEPDNYQANMHLAKIYQQRGLFEQALGYYDRSLESQPGATAAQMRKATVLEEQRHYAQALAILQPLADQHPRALGVLTNLANLYGTMGRFDEAETLYRRVIGLNHNLNLTFSNYYFIAHYNPRHGNATLQRIGREWQQRYAPKIRPLRPNTVTNTQRPLRIGLVSAGLRVHPVGQMILGALEHLPKNHFQLYAYSDSLVDDLISRRLKPLMAVWHEGSHASDTELAQMIRDDVIDILVDMTGHTAGSRMPVMAEEPAPLIVKWVGGLFNTTGLKAVDYLISDSVETPNGVDSGYTEKLIRLPDDYICYTPPSRLVDEPGPLPALSNGYITLGCFNNPAKINEELLGNWAELMQQLPGSQLLLKGGQYSDAGYCERLHGVMERHGIAPERVLLEEATPHRQLVASYRRVDIALDTWPYSGGLTTCEAFYMGVPVVTLPGPTFAGRHSATHLVNVGMPELVTDSWEEYRQRVVELASDLGSLSTIRSHLRDILLQSPVCDGPRFARHFTTAMRAIWQRYCEGKAPEALTFNQDGEAKFADENAPVVVQYAPETQVDNDFHWKLKGKIITIDNSGKLISQGSLHRLQQLNAFGIVAFDPASQVDNPKQFEGSEDVQVFPHVALGDGQPATLHACLDPAFSSTLVPLPLEQQHGANPHGAKVLTKLPISTIALDSIEGLDCLDWLILDDLSDAIAILENGETALRDTLLIQVRIAFQPTHERQPSLAEVQHWMARHGFRFYRFNDEQHRSHLPVSVPAEQRQATELVSADALFLPAHKRMEALSEGQRIKLAFLLHTVFGIKDVAFALLEEVDEGSAKDYWQTQHVPSLTSNSKAGIHDQAVQEKPSASLSSKKESNISEVSEELASEADEMLSYTQPINKISSDSPATTNKDLWELNDAIHVVDVGANPIDGTPPYAGLLKKGLVKLVGFEPQKEALKKLQEMKGHNELYLPHAVGSGKVTKLYLCQAPGMTSTLKPNKKILDHFQGYPIWGKVKAVEEIDTVRLDDVNEVEKIEWLKIDIQGGELNVFQNGEKKLKDALVIQTEVNFIQLYENQPLFAEIDQWMRAHGFMLHTLLEQRKRLYAPMKINGGIHQGINQLTTADAVYVPDFNRLSHLSNISLKKLVNIMHEAYQSYDYVLKIIVAMKDKNEADRYSEKSAALLNASKNNNSISQECNVGNVLIGHPESYLKKMGWVNSVVTKESVVNNHPAPWVTYAFLHFFEKRMKKDFKVFEYGSGNSTIWLSQRVTEVVSVEHDERWYKKMYQKMPSNVKYVFHPLVYGGKYCQEVLCEEYDNKFDIVFVDGRDRARCLKHCLSAINQAGVVVLDNAERKHYNPGSDLLIKNGFKRIDFIGMGPVNIGAWSTAVFYRPGNCLDL